MSVQMFLKFDIMLSYKRFVFCMTTVVSLPFLKIMKKTSYETGGRKLILFIEVNYLKELTWYVKKNLDK